MKRSILLLFFYIASFAFANNSRADILTDFGQRIFGAPAAQFLPWGGGWSHIQSYAGSDGADYFLIYNEINGTAHIHKFATGGRGFSYTYSANWGPGWSHIVPFRINGKNYFLAYNKVNGAVRYNEIANGGTTVTTVWTGIWGTGWSHIIPFYITENGVEKTALLTYNNTTLTAFFNWVNSSLLGAYVAKEMVWEKYDDVHIFSNKTNDNRLIKFNRSTGIIHYEVIRTDFAYLPRVGTYTGIPFSTLTSVAQSADTATKNKATLLLYTPSTGRLEHRLITDIGIIPGKVTLWRKNLSHLTSGLVRSVSPVDGLIVAYSKANGGAQFFRVNDRSKLQCTNINRCEFKNLPLLQQSHPSIPDVPYKDYKDTGCYNTSIVMSIGGALNNRSLAGLPPAGTHTYDVKRIMDLYGINSYLLTQQQYDSQMSNVANPYYFNILLNDYGSDAVRYPAGCNLTQYGNCMSAETKYGDMSRTWARDSVVFTSDDAIENVLSGAPQIIAFNWSDNIVFFGVKTTIQNTSYHKVVVAGFDRSSAFPLLINDPSSGTRRSARIIMLQDSAEHNLIGAEGRTINQWAALEFQNVPGVYNLLDHVDHVRLY